MDSQVEQLVKDCTVCSKSDKTRHVRRVPLSPVMVPNKPWDKLALDIVGPLDIRNFKKKYLVTLVDYNTHWICTKFMHQVTTKEVIKFLWENFLLEGIPVVILTDNGVQFTSNEIEEFLKDLAIKHEYTA